jgi:hypothetical protein
MPDRPGKVSSALGLQLKESAKKSHENFFTSDGGRVTDYLKSGRNAFKKTENVTVKVTKYVPA